MSEELRKVAIEAANVISTIYSAIAHGDDEHRLWLYQRLAEVFKPLQQALEVVRAELPPPVFGQVEGEIPEAEPVVKQEMARGSQLEMALRRAIISYKENAADAKRELIEVANERDKAQAELREMTVTLTRQLSHLHAITAAVNQVYEHTLLQGVDRDHGYEAAEGSLWTALRRVQTAVKAAWTGGLS